MVQFRIMGSLPDQLFKDRGGQAIYKIRILSKAAVSQARQHALLEFAEPLSQ